MTGARRASGRTGARGLDGTAGAMTSERYCYN